MKSSAPWSVKGIERDARETAKEAAKREGMTVGEWLNQIIYRSGAPEDTDGEIDGLKLRDVVTAVEHLNKRTSEIEGKNVDAIGELTRNIGGMVERVQRLERVKPPMDTNSDLALRMEKLEKAGNDRQRIDALKALEKAVSQIAAQFNNTHKTSLQRLDDNERQLQELSARIESVGMGDDDTTGASFLKNAIEGLSTRIAHAERIASEASELKAQATGSVDTTFVERTGERLRVLGDEIKRGGDQIRDFELTISKLSTQIDAAERRSAEGVQKITEVVSDLRDQFSAEHKQSDTALDHTTFTVDELQDEAPEDTAENITHHIEPNIDVADHSDTDEIESITENLNPTSVGAVGVKSDDDENESAANIQFMSEAAPTDDEIEAAIEDSSETNEDFSFDLDVSETESSETAKSLLSEVQNVFSGMTSVKDALGITETTEDTSDGDDALKTKEPDTNTVENDLDAILNNLGNPSAQNEDDEKTDGDPERSPAKALLLGKAASISKEPSDENAVESSTPDARAEEFLHEARRREKKSTKNSDAAKPTRRNLTPKQRAILAARARQKRLAEEGLNPPSSELDNTIDPPFVGDLAKSPSKAPMPDDNEAEDADGDTTFASKIKAFAEKLPTFGKQQDTEHQDEKQLEETEIAGDTDIPASDNISDHNAEENSTVFSTLKASTAARPVTWALGVAILLAAAALFYLVSDLVTKSPNAPTPRQTTTINTNDTTSPETTTAAPAANVDLPTQTTQGPDAPVINPRALYLESMAALNDTTSNEDISIAISTLEQAATLGHPPAQLQLGELYKIGQGVEQDLGQARVWFRRSANGGNILAMHRIGVLTARGDGGPADTSEAIGWFELAANRGLIDSQYNLGAIYHPTNTGSATSIQDAGKAYFWYSLAANNGDDQAAPLAASVAGALTPAQRNQIDTDITAWETLPTDADANEMAEISN